MSWDLTHLGAKYPWLQVNASTLEEFRAPFDWSKKQGCRDEDDKSAKKSSPSAHQRRHKLPHKATSSQTTARQVLLMNTRDHLTDAVVLDRRKSPSAHAAPPKQATNVVETRVVASPSTTAQNVKPPAMPSLQTTNAVPRSFQLHRAPVTSLAVSYPSRQSQSRTIASPTHAPPAHSSKKRPGHKHHPSNPLQPYTSSRQPPPPTQSSHPHHGGTTASAAALARQSKDLENALAQAKNDELALFKSLDDTIQAQRATIPLQFLFERNMSAYCIEKGVETILHVFSTLQAKYLCKGFTKWHQVTAALRKADLRRATEQRVQTKAIALFNRVAGDCLMGNTKRALHRWHRTVKRIVADERHAAATTIQKHVKRRRDTRIVQRMRRERAETDARNAARVLQLLELELRGRQQLWTIREHAGMIRESRALEAKTRNEATLRIQRTYRGHRGRMLVQKLRRLVADAAAVAEAIKQATLLSLRKNSTLIQSIIRMFLVRLRLYNQRMRDAIRSDNALIIQRAWRTKKGKKVMASRFAKRKMSMTEKAERDAFLARQRFLAEMEKRRQASAVTMQRRIRGYLARKHVRLIREARRLDHAARRVQTAWRKAKGRFHLHLRFLAQRERLEWAREAACLRIQTQWRRHLAWKELQRRRRQRDEAIAAAARAAERKRRQETSATDIARVFRGYVVRRRMKVAGAAATKIQRCVRLWRGRRLRQVMKNIRAERKKLEETSAIVIQRHARGMLGRRRAVCRANEVAAEIQRKHEAAAKLQSRLRGLQGRKAATVLRRAHAVAQVESRQSTHDTGKSALELAIVAGDLDSARGIKALEGAICAAERNIEKNHNAARQVQRVHRGRVGRKIAKMRLAEKEARDKLEYESARAIQRIARGRRGRRRVARFKADRTKEALREVYRRERIALEDKKKWSEQLDMEQFKADTVTRKERERKLLIAQQEDEIARLEAQTSAYKVQALEAQKTLKAAQAAAWKPMNDGFGNVFYSNELTGETTWDIPEALQPKVEVVDREEDWEELYNPHTGQIYKHNRVTGAVKMNEGATHESSEAIAVASPPPEPVVDAAEETSKLPSDATATLADAASDAKPAIPSPAPPASSVCWRCKKQPAVKECVNCEKGRSLYCAACFAKEHKAVTKKSHDFKRLNVDGGHSCGMCYKCDSRASHHCSTCELGFQFTCEECFASTHATAEFTAHSTTHFRPGSVLCSQCNKMVALRGCPECQDKFCIDCFALAHAKGKKKTHVPNVLNVVKMPLGDDTDAYCTECDVDLCTKLCNLCGDGFCDSCFATLHAKGRKADHTSIPWKEMTQAGDWIEIYEGKTPMYYNIVTKESSAEKPSVLLLGVERHREMIAEKVRERKKAEGERETELVALREQVKALQEAAELARRQKQELDLLNENPQVLAKPLKKKWWKTKAQLAKEKAERENQVVLSLMLTKQRQDQLHRQAMEVGSMAYAKSIVADIVQPE